MKSSRISEFFSKRYHGHSFCWHTTGGSLLSVQMRFSWRFANNLSLIISHIIRECLYFPRTSSLLSHSKVLLLNRFPVFVIFICLVVFGSSLYWSIFTFYLNQFLLFTRINFYPLPQVKYCLTTLFSCVHKAKRSNRKKSKVKLRQNFWR